MRCSLLAISALFLLSATAYASEKGTFRGDGYRIERVSPAKKSIKVLTPEGATVRITQYGPVEKAKGTIPFEYTPTDSGNEYFLEIKLADGESWWKGSFKVYDRTEYQVYVEGPRETTKIVKTETKDVTPAPVSSPIPAAPAATTPSVMADDDFAALKEAIKGESFSRTKLEVLKTGAQSQSFTIAQIVELVGLFDFGNDKVKVVETVAKQIVDKKNAFKLYSAFNFDSDKEKVKKILAK